MLGKGGDDQDVVSMTEREAHRRRAALRTVEAYWHGLCGADQVPLRADVDPRGIESALENAFLVERIAPGMAKFRVAGSHLSDLMGMQVAGMPVSTFLAPEERDRFSEALKRFFAEPAVLRMELIGETGFGKPSMRGALVLLPLRSDFGDVSRGLGALVTEGRIGRTPRRFRTTSKELEPALDPGAARKAADPAHAPERAPASGLAEAAEPFRPKERKHLRLVVKND